MCIKGQVHVGIRTTGLKVYASKVVILMTAVAVISSFIRVPVASAAATSVSVTDFGANGTDTADDTTAFQSAVDAVASGGTVIIPAGTYVLGQVRISKPLEIAGVGATSLLKLRSGANQTLLAISNTTSVTVRDLAIDGNISGQTGGYPHGIQFTATTDSIVTRVDIRNCEKSAVSVYDGSDRVSVTNSRFDNNENDVEIHSSAYNYCADNYATNTQYESWVSYEQAGGPGKAHHNTIVNNVSIGAYAGINIERSHDDHVQGNTIQNAKWGIMVQGRDSTFSHNETVIDNTLIGGANSTQWGITAENPSHTNTIARNSVSGWLATPLNIQSADSVFEGNTISGNSKAVAIKTSDVIVRNNVFADSHEVGVIFGDALSDVVFAGNTVRGSAEEGVLVLEPLTRFAFIRNTVTGNGATASGTLDGVYSVATWIDSALLGNTIINPAGVAAQKHPVTIPTGSTVAVADNQMSAISAALLPAGTSGTTITVSQFVAESGIWECTASGVPGTWTLQESIPTVEPTPEPAPEPRPISQTSVQGNDRYTTNVAVSQAAYPNGADVVIVATGENWPDALGGATLANAVGGPILLTKRNQLPAVVLAEIRRLGATQAIILGGTNAVGASVESVLVNELDLVRRIGGINRYATAAAIAEACVEALGGTYDGTVLCATGSSFADALAASPLAAAKGWPLVLVGPDGDAGISATLDAIGADNTVILGGTSAVPAKVETALAARFGTGNVERIAGSDRYATSAAIAQWAVTNAGLGWNNLAVATGENFPDALAGGVLQAVDNSVLLLTMSKGLSKDARACIADNRAEITTVKYLGGQSALSAGVRTAVAGALR